MALFFIQCKKNKNANENPEAGDKPLKTMTLPDYWTNPLVMQWGREEVRADFKPVETEELAAANQLTGSTYFINLNGFWKYQFFTGPDHMPADIEKSSSYTSWLDMSMPGFAELKGMGKPIFKYHALPFKSDFPNVPTDSNSVLVLKKSFDIPKNWSDRNIYAVFEGVSTSYFLYINGKLVGYNEDTKAMSEFRIDSFLHQGLNDMTLILIRYTDGSYFESHNQWLMTGLNRSSYILGRPKTRIRDFYATTQLDSKKGILNLSAEIKNESEFARKNYSLECRLVDDANKTPVANSLSQFDIKESSSLSLNSSMNISSVKPWSDEVPSSYTLMLILKNNENKIVEVTSTKIGFTSVEFKNNLLLNSKNVKIKGVACHEFHPINGNILDKTWIDNDMDVMVLHHINAIRTNHYPFESYWYQSALKYGLWIMDECNLNLTYLHQSGRDLSQDSSLAHIYLQRIKNTFEKNKNHGNIFVWSLGYNAGVGQNIQSAFNYIKRRDAKRPVVMLNNNSSFGDLELTDIPNSNKAQLQYCLSSNLGNGLGQIDSKWKKISADNRFSGGFIEDFTDQCFYMKNKAGVLFFGYGGVFGETQSDSFLCNQGLLTSNKAPGPALKNLSSIFSNFSIDVIDAGKGNFRIKNNYRFFESDRINYFWVIDENSEKIKEGKFDKLSLKPGQIKEVHIPIETIERKPGKEYCLIIIIEKVVNHNGMFRFLTEKIEKTCLPVENSLPININSYADIKITSTETNLEFIIQDGSLSVDKKSGLIYSWKHKNKEYLKSAITPMFHRAATDMDIYYKRLNELQIWKSMWSNAQLVDQKIDETHKKKIILNQKYTFSQSPGLECNLVYTILSSNDLLLDISLINNESEISLMPRLSWRFEMESGFGSVQWYGRGPYETYPDRKEGLEIGLYKNTVTEMNVPHIRPQEMSNKADVRWAEASSFTGERLLMIGSPILDLKALPFPNEDLEGKHKYGVDLKASANNYFIIGKELWSMDDFKIKDKIIAKANSVQCKLRLKVYQSNNTQAFEYFTQKY